MIRCVKRAVLLILGVTLLASTAGAEADAAHTRRAHHAPKQLEMVWYAETLDGTSVTSERAEEPINPASVTKVATTLWALESLGPDARFETRVYARGVLDRAHGVLDGDLVVLGGLDPDFQAENAFLLTQTLNELGLQRVTGALVVDHRFAMGWENGSAGRNPDPTERGMLMATRLRQGMDPKRWNGPVRSAWYDYALRRGLDRSKPPRVVVQHGVGVDGANPGELLAIHRSQPLLHTLRRFNCYSNNDIERVAEAIGPVDELASLLVARTGADPTAVQIETASGLGSNRLAPRTIVRLLEELGRTCARLGLRVEDLLPLAGCDPGTVAKFFPLLSEGPGMNAVVGKTGTLTATDGGVSVLAGFASTTRGTLAFCIAVPQAGGHLGRARRAEEQWVLELLGSQGGAAPRSCGQPLTAPDVDATVIRLDKVLPPPATTTPAPAATASAPAAQ
jgi:serine-type D-Ala-D-Ala carboxypeptidase/endopeptidase (penicillin-binding protein 4)